MIGDWLVCQAEGVHAKTMYLGSCAICVGHIATIWKNKSHYPVKEVTRNFKFSPVSGKVLEIKMLFFLSMHGFWGRVTLQTEPCLEYLRGGVQCQGQGASSTPSMWGEIILKGGGKLEKSPNLD